MARKLEVESMIGRKYGRLLVLSFSRKKGAHKAVLCRCECGKEKVIRAERLRRAVLPTRSCGCLKEDTKANLTHGRTGDPVYRCWRTMIQRCENPNHHAAHNYGGRGITVCSRWRNSFEAFLEDMGERPSLAHSIDRKDNSKGYTPDNCRWATRIEQGENRRGLTMVTYKGESKSVRAWERKLGFRKGKLSQRLYAKWPVEKAIETP